MTPDSNDQAALIKEQLFHALDMVRSELRAAHRQHEHDRDLNSRRLCALEKITDDHESRIRDVHKGVTEFRFLMGLAGGSIVLAVIALIRSFLP